MRVCVSTRRLCVCAGAPQWRLHVNFVNSIVIQGLTALVVLSLKHLYKTLEAGTSVSLSLYDNKPNCVLSLFWRGVPSAADRVHLAVSVHAHGRTCPSTSEQRQTHVAAPRRALCGHGVSLACMSECSTGEGKVKEGKKKDSLASLF